VDEGHGDVDSDGGAGDVDERAQSQVDHKMAGVINKRTHTHTRAYTHTQSHTHTHTHAHAYTHARAYTNIIRGQHGHCHDGYMSPKKGIPVSNIAPYARTHTHTRTHTYPRAACQLL